MKALSLIFTILFAHAVFAQPAVRAIEDKSLPLEERYQVMKSGSQTFQNYKVIREHILDGFWNIAMDTLHEREKELQNASNEIQLLKEEIILLADSLKTQQASIQDVLFDSEHINVLGISFGKNFFQLLVAAVVGGLIFLLAGVLARMKIMNMLVNEKTLIADSLSHEYEEFKRKSLEKQTKLSRELQNERNKLMEIRNSY
jgi:hypothetical protein